MGDLQWMLPPLVMCLVLTGIHGYLGIHVLARKVIFVDLSLAQIASLGSICATLLGYDPVHDGLVVYFFSLGFTFVGAAIFALTRMRHERVPQEAFIGIVYATASAVALLLLARSPGESEHIKEMLVGNVLLVTWPTIAKTALIYAGIGAFHIAFRRPFWEISQDAEAAGTRGRRVVLWDFLFYASFGLVITSSVAIAGVLLVFTFLVVPAAIAYMFGERMATRVAVAWGVGTLCSAAGMLVSYEGDLPTGPSVVACFGGVLLLASLAYYLRGAERKVVALGRIAGGAVVVVALFFGVRTLRKAPADHEHEHQHEEAPAAELEVHAPAEPPAADPFDQMDAAEAQLRAGDQAGYAAIARVLEADPPLLVEQQAGQLLKELAGDDFGVGASEEEGARKSARDRYAAWLASRPR
ncbi:MAG TPA: iron chelate uptake ABC transporter family permease subunit [Kofleriaceae bacterium]|nr:iron chelate uptake ABC transporter family permease subunit [Kofleriaceae bacterium]